MNEINKLHRGLLAQQLNVSPERMAPLVMAVAVGGLLDLTTHMIIVIKFLNYYNLKKY